MAVDAHNTPVPDSETSPNDAGLANCPFCGGHPEAQSYEGAYWIACTSCGARGEECEPWEFIDSTPSTAESWAAKAWNTRTSKAVKP